jgi:hypothetical protein
MGRKLMLVFCMSWFLAAGTGVARGGLEDGLVACFQLDEESGTVAADASGNGHDGILYGQALEWAPGNFGGGLFCSTAEGEAGVEFPTTGMSVTAGTVSLWGYLSEPQAARTRYFFGHTTGRPPTDASYADRIQLYMNSGVNTLSLGLGDTHGRQTDIVPLATKKWHHVVLTWNNGSYVVYVNGAKVGEGTYTGLTALDPVASISDDSNPDEQEAFDGILDEARIYNRAISADEVKQLFQVPAAPRIRAWSPSPADGANDVMIPLLSWKSLDIVKLHDVYVGTDPNLTAANLVGPRRPASPYYYPPGLQPGVRYFWRVDEIEADLTTVHPGIVWSFIARDTVAYAPTPADGANTVLPACVLTWLPGVGASAEHLYLGDDFDAVAQGAADTDRGMLDETSFTPTDLQSATRYFWRVEETVGMAVKPGPVWSFTTCVPVDDFESYNDEEDQGTRIYETWIDGYSDGSSGSTVGNLDPPFAEQTIIHGGLQSMPLDYNNVNTPFFSEAYREFSPAQDWTAEDTDTLVLYVQGKVRNSPAPLYVAVTDTSNHTAVVVHPDPAVLKAANWVEWKIPLSDLTASGVKVTAVKRLTIGVGDKDNPTAGGAGLLYIDDIILTKPAPAAP